MREMRESAIEYIKRRYYKRKITAATAFKELMFICGGRYKASLVYSQWYMDRSRP
jgi:hypothetical protein